MRPGLRRSGGHGNPHFCGTTAAVATGCAAQAASVDKRVEGTVDLASLLVATEEVSHFGAGDTGRAILGVCPDGECGFEMLQLDVVGGIEQGVDERQARSVRF